MCLKEKHSTCELSVQSHGETIPEEDLKNLFKRFYRADKSRKNSNSYGLGLSIAGSLVELQGGTMEIVTDGDLFKVILRFGREEA